MRGLRTVVDVQTRYLRRVEYVSWNVVCETEQLSVRAPRQVFSQLPLKSELRPGLSDVDVVVVENPSRCGILPTSVELRA